ncbi:STAS domain-containing protein [Peristeroidobacter soli]|jgi:ABC-type transporter Mla MlaB component|uniref:STAS domain-containing protein n=1 Tax=Peristeroidobacter soli TaxID=2497877 RepID=UPI0013001A94|nr:STAS domain-containing protein [Peristeroidobacter soli]
MKTSKRKRSAKAASVTEATGVDVASADVPVVAEAAMECAVELSPTAVEALVAESVVDASVEQVAEAVAAEAVADVASEPVAAVAAGLAEETVVAEAAVEPIADASTEQAAEAVAEVATEETSVAEVIAEVAVTESSEPAVVGDPIVVLASNCSVKDAAALKTSLCAFSNHGDAVTLDVSAVERVDTATMQLLCAFVRDRSGRNQSVAWRGESEALQDAVRLLGVGELLGFETKGVAA